MIDRTEQITQPSPIDHDITCDMPEATPDAHEILDNSLTSIIGNARMIALDNGADGGQVSQRLAAIIDSAKRISLIVHQQLDAAHPKAARDTADNSQSRGRTERGAGVHPCWI
jgi:hypothetical protein